jgi:hypothetical protein
MGVGDVNDVMGLLPKSAVMVSHLPPLWRLNYIILLITKH